MELHSHLGSTNLRELIEDFRRSRTRNEERMTIQKHRGYLRENMKTLSHEQRANGILKLMWMNMLGYDTEFALVECMNSLFLDNFKLKTIAYLGLTMFLSRKSEVLLMVTNRLRLDLENRTNDFVVSAALKTFSEIADDQMAHELFPILKGLLEHESKYIRKKVCMALKRVLIQKPELTLELKPSFVVLLKENNNGLLLCTLHLARQVMKIKPKEFHRLFCEAQTHLLGKLRQTSAKSSGNYLINGVNDPFIQAEIIGFLLDFLNLPQTKALDQFEDMVSEFGSCLLSVYREIQDFGGSTARAMFYQIARAIMQIPYSAIALKKVGIAILGSFLGLKNRNYLFVSLKMLCLISQKYSSEVSRHNSLIMKCVNDKDFSIKRLALEILLRTTDTENLNEVCSLFFNELRKEINVRRAQEMARQSLQLIQRAAGSRVEVINLIFELLQALHEDVKLSSETLQPFFHLIANGTQLQTYACLRALHLLGNQKNQKRKTLLVAGCWVLGEFGETLTLGKDLKTGGRFAKIQWERLTSVLLQINLPRGQTHMEVSMFLVTALLKIFHKADNLKTKQSIVDWFIQNARQGSDNVSQKCRQYLRLMRLSPSDLEEILESLGFNNESVETQLESKSEGQVDIETLNHLAVQINNSQFAVETKKKAFNIRASSGEEHVVGKDKEEEKEDMDLMALENNNGLQNEVDEMEEIDLLEMDIEIAPGVQPVTNNETPKEDLLVDHNDMDLLGNEFDLGISPNPKVIQNATNDDNDFLGMVNSAPKNNIDKLSQNIDQMINQEINDISKKQETEPKAKKKGLGKPRRGLGKPKKVKKEPATNEAQNDIDFDFLGKPAENQEKPAETNFDLLDDIDLMGASNPVENKTPKVEQNVPKYSALDELDDVLIRGQSNNEVAKGSMGDVDDLMDLGGVKASGPKESNDGTKNYDCLDLDANNDTLLTGGTHTQPTLTFGDDDEFGEDEFVDCEITNEPQNMNYRTFFENNEIRLEHSCRTSGLNRYHIENLFSNKVGQTMTGLRLNIQLQKHVKTKVNRLSSSTLMGLTTRGANQTLELEDQSGFAKPLKIKMILKYTIMGSERVHQFIVDKFV
jgi:hypothetical protein